MNPNDQHTHEAEAFAREYLGMADDEPNEATGFDVAAEFVLIANAYDRFDRGRESKQHTDREHIKAIIADARKHPDYCTDEEVADAILAAPSLSLVAVRDEMARTLAEAMAYERYPDQTVIDNPDVIEVMIPAAERGADALFASGILKPSSEVEAAVLREVRSWIVVRSGFDMPRSELDAYDQKYDVRMHPQKSKHAARVRSGKDEA